MKSGFACILILFILSSCSSSHESSIAVNRIDTVLVYKHDTISDCLPYASIDGIYTGKISKQKLINAMKIKLLNNNKNYQIVSFKFNDGSKFANGSISNLGPIFNNEIRTIFEGLQADAKVYFENIRVFDGNNDTFVLNSIVLHLPR